MSHISREVLCYLEITSSSYSELYKQQYLSNNQLTHLYGSSSKGFPGKTQVFFHLAVVSSVELVGFPMEML